MPPITGEYATQDQILSRAQEYFLVVVHQVTPEPVIALRDEVLPKYRAAFEFEEGRRHSTLEVRKLSFDALLDVVLANEIETARSSRNFKAAKKASPVLYDASAELIALFKRFNLTGKRTNIDVTRDPKVLGSAVRDALWPLVVGLETILHWHFAPAGWLWERRNPPLWRPPFPKDFPQPPEILSAIHLKSLVHRTHGSQEQANSEVLEIDAVDWYMGVELESEFRKRMQACFARWLNHHLVERNESARSAGLIKVPSKRERRHFEWAAKYQIRKASASAIVEECQKEGVRVTKTAVENAVQRVLNAVRLLRRPSKRGPQPKTVAKRS